MAGAEGAMGGYGWMLSAALAAALGSCLFNLLVRLLWRPRAVAGRLRRQGVRGPPHRIFAGNFGEIRRLRAAAAGAALDAASHDFLPLVQPQFCKWVPLYGRVFVYWFGSRPNICVADFAMAKQLLADRTGVFAKNTHPSALRLLGNGLVLANGDDWHRHRKVVHPAFNIDKLKTMTVTMTECARSMVSRWEAQLKKKGSQVVEIELCGQFEELTADVISQTAFGSSYREGKQVFEALKELQFIGLSSFFSVQIPGFGYLPTKKNLKSWRLDRKVRSTLTQIIEKRLAGKDDAGYGDDLLGLMLEAHAAEHGGGKDPPLSMGDIIDECKTFFFAGQETTSHLLSWAMFLLATHPEWQAKLREEAAAVCGESHAPTHDMLAKLKLVNLFLLETLRLYSPLPLIRRRAAAAVELGGVAVPEGAILTIPIAMINRDVEVWGEDAGEFNPLRFDSGSGGGLSTLLSFSMGPRACIGQSFAMVEARAAVAAVLRRFKLELSPAYVHAPTDVVTLRPRHGLPMIVTAAGA